MKPMFESTRRWRASIVSLIPMMALLALLAAAWSAVAAPAVETLERAQWLADDGVQPPPDAAPWQSIDLPDDWNRSRPGFSGQLWYRLAFRTVAPDPSHALFLPRTSAAEIEVFINGIRLFSGEARALVRAGELQRPLIRSVPAAMLRAGDNVMHVRVAGSAVHRHGLSRLTIGENAVVRAQYERRYDLQVQSIAMFGAALLVAGLLALSVWWFERGDPVPLWFGATALAWSISAYALVWPPHTANPQARQLLLFALQHAYVIPLMVLCLRTGGARYRGLETALWCAFAAACAAAASVDVREYPLLVEAASLAKLALTVVVLAWLVRVGIRERRWPLYSLGLALAMVIVLSGHDWARWTGVGDFDDMLLAPFAMPFLILALGVAGLERHLSMARALERGKRELEQRVAEKVEEVERAYRQMQQVMRQRAVLRERQRIMADMHDGLGSGLISLLSQVHARKADLAQIEQRLNDMLTDLRAIVDSLQPVEGDLGVVLGNIRYRMSKAIEAAGVKLIWRVEPLPVLEDLAPDKVLSLQRVVLEALTNALRHAGATQVTVSARVDAERGAIVIVIADDGIGFDVAAVERGHGLRNMRSRAQRLGVGIAIQSSPGSGTRVALEYPLPAGRPAQGARRELQAAMLK